jgi:hypothetical protein
MQIKREMFVVKYNFKHQYHDQPEHIEAEIVCYSDLVIHKSINAMVSQIAKLIELNK